jgi:hypothetical protein
VSHSFRFSTNLRVEPAYYGYSGHSRGKNICYAPRIWGASELRMSFGVLMRSHYDSYNVAHAIEPHTEKVKLDS